MVEIINWLKSFTIGEKTENSETSVLFEDPSINFVFVEIEWADGTVIKEPIDTHALRYPA